MQAGHIESETLYTSEREDYDLNAANVPINRMPM